MATEPVTHVVVFTLKPTFKPAHAAQLLAQMRGAIPGMLTLKFGEINKSPFSGYVDRSNGATHVLVSTHVNAAALRVYQDHSRHVDLAKYLRSVAVSPANAFDVTSHL